jgi:hypothetical protein
MSRTPVLKEKTRAPRLSALKALHTVQNPQRLQFVMTLLFFCCFFIFLLWYIDPAVIYSSNGFNIHSYVTAMHNLADHPQHTAVYTDPWFQHPFILELTPAYMREIVFIPGGWTRLVVTLCIYACHDPITGALVVTALALSFFLICSLYSRESGGRHPLVLRLVPPFFVLLTCARYDLRCCAFLLPVAGALLFAVFYRRLRPDGVLSRMLWLSVLFWIAWYFMQWGCLLVTLFIIIQELFVKERRITPVAVAATVNSILFFAADARFIPLNMTVRWSDFTMSSGLPLVMIGFFPVAVITLAALNRFRRTPEGKVTPAVVIAQVFVPVFVMVAAALWLYKDPVNRDTRSIARTVHHIIKGKWEAVLQENTAPLFAKFPQQAGALQVFMIHAVDQALCRTGRSGDKLFTFPQAVFSYDPLLMLESTYRDGYVNWIAVLDLAMDLGMVNTAEKIAGEIMEKMGPHPDIILRRALVQIAKGNNGAARVYLARLAAMPFYRTEARRLLHMLDNNPAAVSDPRITAMRSNSDTIDYFLFNNVSFDVMLNNLLQSNPGNKTAYDYLMTYFLITGRLEDIAALVPAAPSFGYRVLPRYWEEALCLYQSVNSLKTLSEISFTGIRQETIDRFYGFMKAWSVLERDPEAAARLAPSYGNSYFYFSIFRYSRGTFHE